MKKITILLLLAVMLSLGSYANTANATNSWNGYHWGRTANPFLLQLGDNVSASWDSYLLTTSNDWSVSSVLDTVIKTGATKPRTCKPSIGRVEVCSEKYGFNGWLGVAQVWISGSHITQGTVKMNDSYFGTGTYNTPAWKNLVMCQEVGHALGLDHQDEIFDNANLGTCMDYTNNPSTNQHPNQHDYDELDIMYSHLDTSSTLANSTNPVSGKNNANQNTDLNNPSSWGQSVRENKQNSSSLFVRNLDNGEKVFTFVIWVR